ncbi:MAG TPA: PilN family type IVB pilus formation outer membrane protein [Noviherbaspirillum sp.]
MRELPPVVVNQGIWVSGQAMRLGRESQLPPVFSEPATFDRTVGSLSEFAERMTVRSGIPVRITPDAIAATLRNVQGLRSQVHMPTASAGTTGAPSAAVPSVAPISSGMPSLPVNLDVRIIYANGSFKGLLDTAAARFGVFWRYKDGMIEFYYTDTSVFQISAIPGESSLSATISGGAMSGARGGSGAQDAATGGLTSNNSNNTGVTSQLSVYGSVLASIRSMLSPEGRAVSSPATGTISVTDTPDSLERVAAFVEAQNRSLARQVMVNVTVLAVTVTDAENYGINWNLVYGDLSRRYGVQNTYITDSASSSFSAAILNTSSSRFAGSSLIIDALSNQGKVRKETTASVVTLNNQPVPLQVAKQTSYLRSSSTTTSPNVATTTSLEPGSVTSGFNMTILPHILNDGTVMLQFSTDISALRRIRTVSSNNSSIETPELDTRNFLQRVAMKSGETLVISGFEQTDSNLDRSGVGTPTNFLFGGGYRAQTSKEAIVILITPLAMSPFTS